VPSCASPPRSATAALLSSLEQADPEFQVALLNGLAEKKDPPPLPAVLKMTASRRPALRKQPGKPSAHLPSEQSLAAFTAAVRENKRPRGDRAAVRLRRRAVLEAGKLQPADTVG